MIFADTELASRLEHHAAEELHRMVATARNVDPDSAAAVLDVAGGVAVYLGDGSPVNQAIGLGFAGPMTAEDAGALERFFGERGQRPLAVVSPLAHPSVLERLGARGWVAESFENVLVRAIAPGEAFALSDGLEVRECFSDEERSLWAQIAAIAFSAPLEPLAEQIALARVVAARPHARLLIAYVEGRPAAVGELSIESGIAWLSADGTLPHLRRRGAQQALQATRLVMAVDAGCELAVTEAIPGTASQRNMERIGFSVAYTRVDLAAPKRQEQT